MPDELQISVAIVRCDDELLMVEQAGPGEDPAWTIPGGRVEPSEFATEAAIRETREETGVTLLDLGDLAFVVQVDERRAGWFATVWTWETAAWEGGIAVDDPSGFVRRAAWVPLELAVARLERISWHAVTARYLRGDLDPRPLWLRRVHEDGREEWP